MPPAIPNRANPFTVTGVIWNQISTNSAITHDPMTIGAFTSLLTRSGGLAEEEKK